MLRTLLQVSRLGLLLSLASLLWACTGTKSTETPTTEPSTIAQSSTTSISQQVTSSQPPSDGITSSELAASSLSSAVSSNTSNDNTASSSRTPSSSQSSSSTPTTSQSTIDIVINRNYFMQSITQGDSAQLLNQQVALVANREAILRTFVTGHDHASTNTDLNSTVTFYYKLATGRTGSFRLEGPASIPQSINEADLTQTFNAKIPANIIVPGTEYYIEVDSNNAIPESNESNNRYPQQGYAPLKVATVKPLDIVLVPVVVRDVSPNTSADALKKAFNFSLDILPIPSYTLDIIEPYVYDGSDWDELLQAISTLQISNGERDRYYVGLLGHPLSLDPNDSTAGYGYVGFKTMVSLPYPSTIAHELGHNFGREHAPCGRPASPDSNYPYPDGQLGVYGFFNSARNSGIVLKEGNEDVMSYCNPAWISDYTYEGMLSAITVKNTASAHVTGSQKTTLTNSSSQNAPAQKITALIGSINNSSATIKHVVTTPKALTSPSTSPYSAEAYNENGELLSRAYFTPYSPDHSDNLHFSVSLSYPKQALATRYIIRHNSIIIGEFDVASSNKK
ncbi:M66 family metalloprotease [Marinagarivorans algicola]|uniref:M66 family metalloprotease n=1 Tax=Marinagarivorans algicola TaxID=1513270 RepID=UPI000B19B469|nr:M66 family metalloprotease [Marinagarivorans algicola]